MKTTGEEVNSVSMGTISESFATPEENRQQVNNVIFSDRSFQTRGQQPDIHTNYLESLTDGTNRRLYTPYRNRLFLITLLKASVQTVAFVSQRLVSTVHLHALVKLNLYR